MSTTYQMSRDYEALYDLLCKGGEALGWQRGGSKYPSGVAIRMTKEGAEVLHVGSTVLHNDRDIFLSVCHELNLEWIAPSLPLAMSEEEVERIGKSISADHEFYRDAIGVTNIIDIVRQTLHYANARSKSLTVEKGRTFTEGEVKSMLDDAEMLARIMGALVLDVDEARAMAESDISTIKVRHGISLDPA